MMTRVPFESLEAGLSFDIIITIFGNLSAKI